MNRIAPDVMRSPPQSTIEASKRALESGLSLRLMSAIEGDRQFFARHHMVGRNGNLIPAGGGGVDVEGFERAQAEAASREQVPTASSLTFPSVKLKRCRFARTCAAMRNSTM